MPKLKCDWSHDLPGFRHFKSGRLPGWEICWWIVASRRLVAGCCLLQAVCQQKLTDLPPDYSIAKGGQQIIFEISCRTSWTCKLHHRISYRGYGVCFCSWCSFLIRCYSLVSPKSLFGDKFGCWRALNTFNGPTLATWQRSSRMWLMEVRKTLKPISMFPVSRKLNHTHMKVLFVLLRQLIALDSEFFSISVVVRDVLQKQWAFHLILIPSNHFLHAKSPWPKALDVDVAANRCLDTTEGRGTFGTNQNVFMFSWIHFATSDLNSQSLRSQALHQWLHLWW